MSNNCDGCDYNVDELMMSDGIQMTLVPFYCSESVLRMFIEHYKTQIDYLKWYYRRD